MRRWSAVLMVGVLAGLLMLCAGPVMAAGIPVEGAEIGPGYWLPLGGKDADGEKRDAVLAPLQLTLKPYNLDGPDTPTNMDEIVPWAKANLGIDIPFEGDSTTFLRPRGVGVSEAIRIGTVAKVPIRVGIGWLSGAGTCGFLKATSFEF